MLIYWLLPKISAQKEKASFFFYLQTNHLRSWFGSPSMGCTETLN